MILTVTLNPAIDKVYQVNSFTVGNVFRSDKMWVTAGGKGINVARVASILGEKVIATGFLGGNNGRFISEQLEKTGIEDAFVEVAAETRTCIAINDLQENTSTEILEPGPNISLQEQNKFIDNFQSIIAHVDLVTISGSLPKGVSTEFYGELIKICHQYGKKVILDTSGNALVDNLSSNPFMIKPNKSELEAIVGTSLSEVEIIEVAKQIQSKGIETVCITLGAEGCIAVTDQGIFRLWAPAVEAINTVGSGDSFIAGCAVAFSKGLSILDVLKTGMACGIANTQFAETGKVSPELVDKFFDLVALERY